MERTQFVHGAVLTIRWLPGIIHTRSDNATLPRESQHTTSEGNVQTYADRVKRGAPIPTDRHNKRTYNSYSSQNNSTELRNTIVIVTSITVILKREALTVVFFSYPGCENALIRL